MGSGVEVYNGSEREVIFLGRLTCLVDLVYWRRNNVFSVIE